MKKSYEVLLLDLDNTLFDFEHSEKYALMSTANHYGLGDCYEHFEVTYHEVNKPLWLALERGEIDSDAIKVERFSQLILRLELSFDPYEMSDFYIQRLGEGIEMYPHAEEVCALLKQRYKLVAVTNGIKAVQDSRINRSGLNKYFDAIIISEEVGVSKPHPQIFEYALKAINHEDKETVLMIGDSMKADILGAHKAGIDTCWVNIKSEDSPDNPVFLWEVKNLKELLTFL